MAEDGAVPGPDGQATEQQVVQPKRRRGRPPKNPALQVIATQPQPQVQTTPAASASALPTWGGVRNLKAGGKHAGKQAARLAATNRAQFSILLDRDLRRKFRVACILREVQASQVIEAAVRKFVAETGVKD